MGLRPVPRRAASGSRPVLPPPARGLRAGAAPKP